MEDDAKEGARLSVMQPAPAVLPKLTRPKLGAHRCRYPQGEGSGRKTRPVAGKSFLEDRKEPTTIYIAAKDKRRRRLLAASEGRCVNDPLLKRSTIFSKGMLDRLP